MLIVLWLFLFSAQIFLISHFAFNSLQLYCVRLQKLDVPYVPVQFSLKLWLTPERRGSIFSGTCCVQYLLHLADLWVDLLLLLFRNIHLYA